MSAVRYIEKSDGTRVKFEHRNGSWYTEDGIFVVEYVDDFETDCEAPHPMRFSKADYRRWREASEYERRRFPWEFDMAMREGKKGYQCPGLSPHYYALWVAGAVEGEPQVICRVEQLVSAMGMVVAHMETGDIWA